MAWLETCSRTQWPEARTETLAELQQRGMVRYLVSRELERRMVLGGRGQGAREGSDPGFWIPWCIWNNQTYFLSGNPSAFTFLNKHRTLMRVNFRISEIRRMGLLKDRYGILFQTFCENDWISQGQSLCS